MRKAPVEAVQVGVHSHEIQALRLAEGLQVEAHEDGTSGRNQIAVGAVVESSLEICAAAGGAQIEIFDHQRRVPRKAQRHTLQNRCAAGWDIVQVHVIREVAGVFKVTWRRRRRYVHTRDPTTAAHSGLLAPPILANPDPARPRVVAQDVDAVACEGRVVGGEADGERREIHHRGTVCRDILLGQLVAGGDREMPRVPHLQSRREAIGIRDQDLVRVGHVVQPEADDDIRVLRGHVAIGTVLIAPRKAIPIKGIRMRVGREVHDVHGDGATEAGQIEAHQLPRVGAEAVLVGD
mmetsp:Transcript_137699/g.326221  ORF Transcript_137699/g.326221 Transcript_137699/m.326221 type:complete len:293 (+) Transcript_137699:2803-3681(+)